MKIQPISKAVVGKTFKFVGLYEGPYKITKFIPPSTYEIADRQGRIRGEFNKKNPLNHTERQVSIKNRI